MNEIFTIKDKIKTSKAIKIEVFKKHVRKTAAHKHNKYLELVFFTNASGFHTIDNHKIEVKPGTFFVVRKEQVHFWDLDSEPNGYVILLKKSFVDNSLDLELKKVIAKISAITYRYFESAETLINLFDLLIIENKSENNTMILEGLLKALLAKVIQSDNNVTQTKIGLYSKFMDVLNTQEVQLQTVDYYATILNTTPQNLNNCCKKEHNTTASSILTDRIIMEAKRLLIYTDLTISEISYTLFFKDNSHFGKYFKRIVGTTPSEFRSNT
ncbi:AraC family transcriptional regulator [Flavicella sediminum]|uniref:AraC family transcriptional regulator n=1 Tax=Flavicella sediminum TaxID=2585141 RepID=UPI00111D9213|nr:helix-turn-helix domain-containing protein [Flavicella sediminum]